MNYRNGNFPFTYLRLSIGGDPRPIHVRKMREE